MERRRPAAVSLAAIANTEATLHGAAASRRRRPRNNRKHRSDAPRSGGVPPPSMPPSSSHSLLCGHRAPLRHLRLRRGPRRQDAAAPWCATAAPAIAARLTAAGCRRRAAVFNEARDFRIRQACHPDDGLERHCPLRAEGTTPAIGRTRAESETTPRSRPPFSTSKSTIGDPRCPR
jgi:hypothetical protein